MESVKIFGAEAKDPAASLKEAKAFAEVGAFGYYFIILLL